MLDEADIDRARELASIGAGHAATALASLIGRTCEMRVPTVEALATRDRARSESEAGLGGVLFELHGEAGGVLALMFSAATRERLLAHLLGVGPGASDPGVEESALREVGNILASHAANAVGEMLGVPLLPSLPRLALRDASRALEALIAGRRREAPTLRIETEISDRANELCGLLVWVPDRIDRVAGRASI